MSIREIRVYAVPLEAKASYTMSSSSVSVPTSTVVALQLDDGTVGFGEVCLASAHYQPAHNDGVRASLELLAPTILGLDPMHLDRVNAALDAVMTGHNEGKAALDIACWDALGKRLDRHVVDLLGGRRQDRVRTYHVVGIGSPEEAAATAEALQEAGHTHIQLKAGGRPIHDDVAAIRAVADTLRPGTALAVDTNRGWTLSEAIRVSIECADLPLSFEQPCATEAELRQLRDRIPHPIIVDENATDLPTIARLISDGVASAFGLKISRVGGLTKMRAVRDLCMATRTPMSSDDAWGGDIIAAAGVALGATLAPELNRGAWLALPYHQHHYDEANGPRLEGGFVSLPEGGPGLGLVIDEAQFGDPVAVYTR